MSNVRYLVKASHNVKDLTGKGMEYLLDAQGEVIAIFIDGMMNGRQVTGKIKLDTALAVADTAVAA